MEPHPSTVAPVRRRRRKIVDSESLAAAVINVGFERLTIEGVAMQLGTSNSAIYHHIDDRDALVALAMDVLVNNTQWPSDGDDWRAYLDGCAVTLWSLLHQHPGLALELTRLAIPSAAYRARIREMCDRLETLGVSPADAFLAVDLVMDLAFDAATRSHFQDRVHPHPDTGAAGEWFRRKLDVVLDGIGTRFRP